MSRPSHGARFLPAEPGLDPRETLGIACPAAGLGQQLERGARVVARLDRPLESSHGLGRTIENEEQRPPAHHRPGRVAGVRALQLLQLGQQCLEGLRLSHGDEQARAIERAERAQSGPHGRQPGIGRRIEQGAARSAQRAVGRRVGRPVGGAGASSCVAPAVARELPVERLVGGLRLRAAERRDLTGIGPEVVEPPVGPPVDKAESAVGGAQLLRPPVCAPGVETLAHHDARGIGRIGREQEVATVAAPRGQAAEAAKGRSEIHERREAIVGAPRLDARPREDQGHVHRGPVTEVPVRGLPVRTERLPVVRGHDDERGLGVDERKQLFDRGVGPSHLTAIQHGGRVERGIRAGAAGVACVRPIGCVRLPEVHEGEPGALAGPRLEPCAEARNLLLRVERLEAGHPGTDRRRAPVQVEARIQAVAGIEYRAGHEGRRRPSGIGELLREQLPAAGVPVFQRRGRVVAHAVRDGVEAAEHGEVRRQRQGHGGAHAQVAAAARREREHGRRVVRPHGARAQGIDRDEEDAARPGAVAAEEEPCRDARGDREHEAREETKRAARRGRPHGVGTAQVRTWAVIRSGRHNR